jgi:amidase
MRDLHLMSAVDLASMIASHRISAVELLEHFLSRVARHNPGLNAIIWMDADRARTRAREADAAFARGQSWGPLHGLPMTIKESYQLAGSPTTWGNPEHKANLTDGSALAVDRLLGAGAIIFGKSNVPFMLADWQSHNAIHGTTRNPWNPERTPGGSSGGSAAALAAGLTAAEIGSDIGASIRNPAHYCGVFGLKPTYGIIPQRGQSLPGFLGNPDIAVNGPLARSAGDLDLLLDVMAGPDLLDDQCWRLELPKCTKSSLGEMRVAVKLADPNSAVDSSYGARLQALVDSLAKKGAKVKEAEPMVDTLRLQDVYVHLLRAATSIFNTDEDVARWKIALAEHGAQKEPYLAQMIAGVTLPHRQWLALDNERQRMRMAFQEFFEDWDVLLCPAAASAAWPHDQAGERWQRKIVVDDARVPTTDQLFWAGYSGVVYLPSTVGPAGLTREGLPVGYQAIAAHGRDKTATAFSRLVEREIVGFAPPPGYQ